MKEEKRKKVERGAKYNDGIVQFHVKTMTVFKREHAIKVLQKN